MEINELKRNSINATGKIVVCWPQYGEIEEELDMTKIGSDYEHCFAFNNSVICFVTGHEVFVTPYTKEAMSVLEDERFKERIFHVPFSNWDYPKFEKEKWELLCEQARKR